MSKGVIIIGAGHGGVNLAIALRTEKYQGPVTLLSDEADLPYQRPPLSKTFVKGSDLEADEQKLLLRPQQFYADKAITLQLDTRVSAINTEGREVRLEDGSKLEYEQLVIATGTRARSLPLPGIDLKGVEVIRTLDDARRIRSAMASVENVAVIGGGFIGLEFAATAKQMGKTVTVLEAADRLMGRSVAPVISDYVLEKHRDSGIDIQLGASVEALQGKDGHVAGVQTTAGNIPAELVIVGVGALPNSELAEAAGIACDNGVIVSNHMRTSVQNVFAIGDCAAHKNLFAENRQLRLESIQNATDQARTVAKVIAGTDAVYEVVPWFWSDQGDMKLQMVGLSFDATETVTRGDPASGKFSVFHYRDEQLIAIDSINQPGDHLMGRKLIGGHTSPPVSDVGNTDIPLKSLL